LQNTNSDILTQLLKGCKKNDRRSQQAVYEQHYNYVMYVAFMYANSKLEAREILNDAFFKVFKNIDKYDESKPFKPWLRRITINTALNQYRKKKRRGKIVELDHGNATVVANQVEHKLSYEELIKVLNLLPPQYKMVFTLYNIEGYSHQEIADQLKIKVGTSKSNLFRAKKILQDYLVDYFDVKYAR